MITAYSFLFFYFRTVVDEIKHVAENVGHSVGSAIKRKSDY